MIYSCIILGAILLTILGYVIYHLYKKDLKLAVSEIPAKYKGIYEKTRKRWFFYPILILVIYLISFVFYDLLSAPLGSPNVDLFKMTEEGSVAVNTIRTAATTARTFIANLSLAHTSIIGWGLIIIVGIIFLIFYKNKKLTFFKSIVFIIVIGAIIRITYANTTDAIFTRQYDVWSSSGYGHHGITLHIYHYFTPLPLKEGGLDNCYQLYHPKFSHYVHALIMHINSIFYGNSDPSWTLYQSIRIFTCANSIIMTIVTYHIFKELTDRKPIILIGTLFVTLSPQFIRFSALTNNDPLLYLFMLLSILFAIKFYKNQSIFNTCVLAVSIGLAMSSKLSGALIAIVIGVLMILVLIKLFKQKEINKIFTIYPIFAAIVFPIGLFWPTYNFINYNQSFTYVWHNLNEVLLFKEEYSYIDKFLTLRLDNYFNHLYMILSNTLNIDQSYNLYFSMIKSSIFGEYSYIGIAAFFSVILYVINLILVFALGAFGIYKTIKDTLKKKYTTIVIGLIPLLTYLGIVLILSNISYLYPIAALCFLGVVALLILAIKNKEQFINSFSSILMAGIFLVFMVSYFTLQISYTYSCSQDFRYIGLFCLVGGYFISLVYESFKNKEQKLIFFIILGIYLLSSVGMYISLGF